MPATEKQFTGNLPTGTYVEVTENMASGAHWENVGTNRIDLDLSVQDASGKIGWDARYRDNDNAIFFSGDITDSPKSKGGASELFHIGGVSRGAWLNVNYYNYSEPCQYRSRSSSQCRKAQFEQHHAVDPNSVVAQSTSEMSVKQKTLGIIVADDKGTRSYFAESDLARPLVRATTPTPNRPASTGSSTLSAAHKPHIGPAAPGHPHPGFCG